MNKIKFLILSITMLSISTTIFANFKTYTIIYGGGVDDIALGLKDDQGRERHAYCLEQCGDWFDPSSEHEGYTLKKKYICKEANVDLSYEINADRIVGPGDDAELFFIKGIELINQKKPKK